MKKPVTYADWIEIFEHFGNGNDDIFEKMDSGSFDLDAGTAQRFYTKAEEAYKKRKQNWLEKFQRSFQTQNIKSSDDFGIILLTAKKNLTPLLKFSNSKGLPEDLKNVLKKDLAEFVTEIKKSLKENISKTDNSKEKMLITINSFNLPEMAKENQAQINSKNNDENSSTMRKIIF